MKPDGTFFYNCQQVTEMLGVSKKTLRRYVKEGRFPPALDRFKPRLLWSRAQIEQWSRQ